jgi:general secretion pathway protein J
MGMGNGHRESARRRAHARGLTLIEVLVAVAVLAMISTLIYAAFAAITRGKQNAGALSERFRVARMATDRMSRELSEAFLSAHVASTPALITRVTNFLGSSRRVDFTAFAHRRVVKDAHESDQNELGYFLATNAKNPNQLDLVRREKVLLDDQFARGGVVQVMVDDVDSFSLKYLDPMSGLWTETWDASSGAAQLGRVPLQVEITLIIRGGPAGMPVTFHTKTTLMIQQPLAFALK